MRVFDLDERESLGRWAGIFMRSQLGIINEIIEKKSFRPDDVKEVLARYLDADEKKIEELIEVSAEFNPGKLGVLFMLMALDDRIYEDVYLNVLYSDVK